jgi:hypothetical protein
MMVTLRKILAVALISSTAIAHEPQYDPNAKYVRLLAVDSIELSTQLWIAIRASVEPKRIHDLVAPDIGFEWEDGASACRIRAIPTTGLDAYDHTSVGYYLEIQVQGVESTISKLCAQPIQKLNEWYFSIVLRPSAASGSAKEVYVREFRAIDPKLEVVWHSVQGKELMSSDNVITDIVGGKQ